ncbi:MAG: caspase domain-containing protein, partial [Ekhidna sp.]
MKNLLIVLAFVTIIPLSGQIVSSRSNEIEIAFDEDQKPTSFAKIKWISPRLEYTNFEEGRIEIKAEVSSQYTLESVTLHIKKGPNKEKFVSRSIAVDDPNNVSVDMTMKVFDGETWLIVEAKTTDGSITRDLRNIKVGMDAIGDAVMADRQDYALLFGTNKYDNWSDLVNPVYDVEAIGKELEERYGFKVEIVIDPEQNDVMTKLREYAQINYKPQDQLLIFFAGHGQYDDVFGEGFLVAKNSLRNDVSKNSYISHNRIRSNINNIPCEHIFLTMDVCFGGTFDPLLASSRSAAYEMTDDREYLVRKLSKKTRKYLTSGSKEYVSDGVAGGHSPFAR